MKFGNKYWVIALLMVISLHSQAQQFSVAAVSPQPNLAGSKIYVTPNPLHANSYFYVELDSCEANNYDRLIIYNSSGFLIQSKLLRIQAGDNRFLINMSGFDPGTYVVRMVGKDVPEFSYSTQIVIDL